MDIECPNPECGKVLSVPDGMRGQTAKCPDCDAGIQVPDEPAEAASECPECGSALAEEAVICVQCGYNLKTGEHMHAASAEPEDADAEEEDDEAPSPVADLVSSSLGLVVKLRWVILFIAIVALALTVFGNWWRDRQRDAERAADKEGEAMQQLAPTLLDP